MKFRTEISIPASPLKIEHEDKILTLGSCFAENIGEKFSYYLFNVFPNPFGVLYNPVSIYNSLELALSGREFAGNDLFFDKEEWHSFYHHSDFSHHEPEECLKKINSRSKEVREFIKQAEWIIITLGTSFVYRHKEREQIVSNCHRIPADRFERMLLSPDESEGYLNKTISLLRKENKNIKIILTVSPVRHIKDGFAENQLSKSSLVVAVHNSVKRNENVLYFPSYEIVMDDLRDYRFYERDLLHPDAFAVEYIWEKFGEAFLSGRCREVMSDIEPYASGIRHRINNTESPNSKKFIESLESKKESLIERYPYLNLT